VRSTQHPTVFVCLLFFLALCVPKLQAQGVSVSAKILLHLQGQPGDARQKHKTVPNAADVVVWLEPLQATSSRLENPPRQIPRLVQKGKQFSPHLLVIPTGTSVEFPNQDPFFHNVFSLYNGKRFDLGLYEPGTSRSVRFDREGVSYIFCNIHPQMGAIVLALKTPYYGISTTDGTVLIRNVPPGSYRLNLWSEKAQTEASAEASRVVQVSTTDLSLGDLTLQQTPNPMGDHKNKFGEEYSSSPTPRY
jgi:plastocyanin